MKATIHCHDFLRAFKDAGRGTQFSRVALSELFDYLEQLESDSGVEIELDVVAICCDYTESTFAELIEQYDIPIDFDPGKSELDQIVDWMTDRTSVVAVLDDSIVYANF